MKSSTVKNQAKQTTYGRPRLLSHEEILEGAVELGLEGLTMKRLATHLNVGTATLYQYFDSRKTLMRAAAVYSLSDVPLPEDKGQHWSQLARDYVETIQSLLAENPSFIHSYQHTDYGFEVQFQLIEKFLHSMSERGFKPEKGMELFNIIGMAAFAGAIEITRQREFEFQDETMEVVAKRQFARLDAAAFPMMAQALSTFTQTPEQKIELLLSATFKTIARERGEDESEIV
ncbi:TetR/AcrR family transcriptional regulator [Hellea sp.]|nr:TetR/AcrR family transcriptional regulator [Hellea sp.]